MTNEMEKKSNTLVIILVIIIILLMVLCGLLATDVINFKSNEKTINCPINDTVENDKMNESENMNTADHVELEDSVKAKLKETFKFVYAYYNEFPLYCGNYSTEDYLKFEIGNTYEIYNASLQFSSFDELINYLKNYMTEHVIYGINNMSVDNYKEKDGKLYCPKFGQSVYTLLDSTIKYSKPYDEVIYTQIEAKVTYDDSTFYELYNVTFEQKYNNWVISSYEKISND